MLNTLKEQINKLSLQDLYSIENHVSKLVRDKEIESKSQLEDLPEYGDIFKIDHFHTLEEQGSLDDDNSIGYWATETQRSRLDVFDTPQPKWATHVLWLNK